MQTCVIKRMLVSCRLNGYICIQNGIQVTSRNGVVGEPRCSGWLAALRVQGCAVDMVLARNPASVREAAFAGPRGKAAKSAKDMEIRGMHVWR